MSSPEARMAAQRFQDLNSLPLKECCYTVNVPLDHPLVDLGFALASLPAASTDCGTVIVHSCWSLAAQKVGRVAKVYWVTL